MKFVLTLTLGALLCWGFYNAGKVRAGAAAAADLADQASECVKSCNASAHNPTKGK
jgi:hypothetical protein